MKETIQSLAGASFGKWTVLDQFVMSSRGERKWLCRCECGTQRYVLERSLKHGGSKSCGCLRKEEAQKAIAILDIEGKSFGDLTVLHKAEHQRNNGGIWWTCRCSCGSLYDVPATLLATGKRTHCGSNTHKKNYAYSDITNQHFNRLTALYSTGQRDKGGNVIWHCRCECGNEVDVSYNWLMHTNLRSCGCQKKENNQKLQENLTRVAGTSLDILRSRKIPANNTSGVKGVYMIRGKWVAKIVFQKKQYFLGSYTNFADAVRTRQDAEKTIRDGTTAHYDRWKEKADKDPEWAKNNPISIYVEKKLGNTISIHFFPEMSDI